MTEFQLAMLCRVQSLQRRGAVRGGGVEQPLSACKYYYISFGIDQSCRRRFVFSYNTAYS